MSTTSEVEVVEGEAPPPPPLKKRATKRGLSKTLSASEEVHEPQTFSHTTNVYSGRVKRSTLCFSEIARKPLFSNSKPISEEIKNPAVTEWPESQAQRPARAAKSSALHTITAVAAEPPVSSIVVDDDLEIIEENSFVSTDDVSIIRSPSPPVPPPPPAPVRAKSKRVSKGIRNAFKALDSMKGELQRGVIASPSSVIVLDESPVRRDSMVVKVRHIQDIHRFHMAKTDMFYSLQQQMADLLGVDADQIGLYLNDQRLASSDTPLSTQLHLADIIVCHVLVSKEAEDGDADVCNADSIRIQMQCRNSRQNTCMAIKKFPTFKRMMEKYAQMRGKPVERFEFHFDGERLTSDMSPCDVDLEDDDTIDVVEKM